MPFGNNAGPTVVYAYYARRPSEGIDLVRDQFLRIHRYKNSLVEAELDRRRLYGELLARHNTDIQTWEGLAREYEAKISDLLSGISARNADKRSRTSTAADKAQLAEWRQQKKLAWAEVKAAKKIIREDPRVSAECALLEAKCNERVRELRSKSGLYWGNYLAAEQDIPRHGPPPRFKDWSGGGKISVQIQHGMTMEQAFSCSDNRIRILRPPPETYVFGRRPTCEQKRQMRTWAMLRIGSDERAAPIWCRFPVLLHRVPPDDARIKWAHLVRRRAAGTSEEWSFQLVLERPGGWAGDAAASGAVEIAVGWKLVPEGMSVATVRPDEGQPMDWILDRGIMDRWQHAESIESIRRNSFNAQVERVAQWLAAKGLPDEVGRACEGMAHWRSSGRLARLRELLADHPFPGSEEITAELDLWNRDDQHLRRWACAEREKAIAIRNEMYRRAAADLRRRYHTIRISGWNIAEALRRPAPDDKDGKASVRKYHRIAAPGLLRQLVCAKAGEVVKMVCERSGDGEKP